MASTPDKRDPKRPQPIESYRWFFVVDKARRTRDGSMPHAKLESLIAERTRKDRGVDTSFSGALKRRVAKIVRASFPAWGPAEWLLTMAVGLTLVGFLVTPSRKTEVVADQHYTNATQMIKTYETGKPPWQRNYRDTVYATALKELSLVDAGSPWLGDARQLSQDISDRIAKFEQGLEAQRGQQLLRKIGGSSDQASVSKPAVPADKAVQGRVTKSKLP